MSFPHGFSQLPPLTSRGRIRWVPLRQRGCGLPPAFPERPRSMSFTWANLDAKMWENVGWSWWMIQMIVNASLFWGEVYNCIHGAWRIYKEIIHQHPMNMSLFTATGISDYPRQRVAGLPNRFAGACFGTFGTNCLQKVRDSESMLCDLCLPILPEKQTSTIFFSLANIQTIMVNKQQSKESKFSDRKREVCSSPEKPLQGGTW